MPSFCSNLRKSTEAHKLKIFKKKKNAQQEHIRQKNISNRRITGDFEYETPVNHMMHYILLSKY